MDIILNNICVNYNDKTVINNFTETILSGDYVAVTGESGSGKTTLLNIIGLLETIQEGELLIGKYKNPTFKSKIGRELLTYDIGYIFQNFALVDNETVEENLDIIRGKNKGAMSNIEALEKVGLAHLINKKIFTLSGGEQQRVAIARLLIKNPKIILADEPTGSLDKKNRDIILDLLDDLSEQGKTIIMVTHDEYVASQAKREVKL